MKIEKIHVGSTVTRNLYQYYIVLFVGKDQFFASQIHNNYEVCLPREDSWEVVNQGLIEIKDPEGIKPSNQIYGRMPIDAAVFNNCDYVENLLNSTIDFLDHIHEMGKI